MNGQRPAVLTTMAILNFVFGGLFLICGGCGLAFALGGSALLQGLAGAAAAKGGPEAKALADLSAMIDAIPGYYVVTGCGGVLGLILDVLLIVAGAGLLKVQVWARWLSVGTGAAAILLQLVTVGYTFAIVQPKMNEWARDYAARTGQPAPTSNVGGSIGTCAGSLFNMAYPTALIVVMLLPATGAAFNPSSQPGNEPGRW